MESVRAVVLRRRQNSMGNKIFMVLVLAVCGACAGGPQAARPTPSSTYPTPAIDAHRHTTPTALRAPSPDPDAARLAKPP